MIYVVGMKHTIDSNLILKRVSSRAPRRDGSETQKALLEAAGRIFGERGYSDATSKEICALAGTNSAAVNYYFGGKEGLYEKVLVAAHHQMLSLDDLNKIIDSGQNPEDKLMGFLKLLIQTAISSSEL